MVKVKVGGEEQTVGHTVRAKVVKNKVAPPFRKGEFPIFYDGRKQDPADEIGAVAMLKGLIPKYDSAGNISATGRTYKLVVEDEELIAKKKDDVVLELRKYPKIQAYLVDQIKNGVDMMDVQEQHEFASDMSDEDFERQMREEAEGIKKGTLNEAEEEETGWDSI